MLKVEYPCREILSTYQNPVKPIVTWLEAKKHLHDIRLRRQTQLASTIDQCHKLRNLHKQIFHGQLDSQPVEKCSSNKLISNDYSLSNNKYSVPRMEYASVIYRQALPTFEIDQSIQLENQIPIVKELTEFLTESSSAIPKQQLENHSSLLSRNKIPQRRFSVSTVSSIEKQANKVYEKWPDYNQISNIVGYRIDPPVSKAMTPNSLSSSRPSDTITRRKQTKSTGFPTTSKQIKNVVGLKSSSAQRQSSKNKKSTKVDLIPAIPEQAPPPAPKPPIKDVQPKLPTILCPSSSSYSYRAQTRQWLIRNHFASNAIRTVPLL